MRVLKSVGLFYLCYDRQDAHHSNKNGQGGWGEMNDLEKHAEILIIVTEVRLQRSEEAESLPHTSLLKCVWGYITALKPEQ